MGGQGGETEEGKSEREDFKKKTTPHTPESELLYTSTEGMGLKSRVLMFSAVTSISVGKAPENALLEQETMAKFRDSKGGMVPDNRLNSRSIT